MPHDRDDVARRLRAAQGAVNNAVEARNERVRAAWDVFLDACADTAAIEDAVREYNDILDMAEHVADELGADFGDVERVAVRAAARRRMPAHWLVEIEVDGADLFDEAVRTERT